MADLTLEKDPALAPAAEAVAEEIVTLVNQGRGDLVILPGKNGTLQSDSRNTLSVPLSIADRVRRHNKFVKNVKDIFPDMPDLAKLQAENAALKKKAETLEKLLNGADLGKKAAADAALADKKGVEDALSAANERITDLNTRLQAFLAADKKDLPALQKEHADAVDKKPVGAA